MVCLAPQLFLLVYPNANVVLPGLPAAISPTPVLQPLPCLESSLPGCQSIPLLVVWMNVSSLSPWLLAFHTVQFSGSSGCFLFLNWLFPCFVVQGGEAYLPTPPSWLELPNIDFRERGGEGEREGEKH